MNEEQYISERIDGQIRYYSSKSTTNKKLYQWSKGVVIVFSALIPFISGFLETGPKYLSFVIGLLGMLVAILVGISELLKFQDKWTNYRTTAEILMQEKYLYQTKSIHYLEDKNRFNKLVSRVETLLSTENSEWAKMMSQEQEV